ncbi:ADP-ribosylglycohydrolase family protein [Micromonospora sp. CPCC 206061]|uniref:ADP-ribosylglycohydrolase family protein n=1 Tax=Micromonospora sp. CPCC 206061 TaxID=3122410 RepID=UPI002FF08B57
MRLLLDKSVGCLVGAAVGDALGGATETALPEEIRNRYGGWVDGIVPPFHENWATNRPLAPYHKGDGHITDDTLMTHALVRAYAKKRDHLDAYDVIELLVPDLIEREVYIPDLEREAVAFHRLAAAERWLVTRLHHAHADPREAGVGNIVNCGAAMYMAPVGVVNAGDPAGAYAEAIEVAGAHQYSYGREAAAVFAAAVAAAMAPGAVVGEVVEAALDVARDGTGEAISAVVHVANGYTDWRDAIAPLRAAVAAYDTVGEDYRNPGLGARRPSRLHSIEELPVALGMLVVANGGYREAVLGAVNYGRDSDSTATMAGAIAGALGGSPAVPAEWASTVASASRTDLAEPGRVLADVAAEVYAADKARFARRAERYEGLR